MEVCLYLYVVHKKYRVSQAFKIQQFPIFEPTTPWSIFLLCLSFYCTAIVELERMSIETNKAHPFGTCISELEVLLLLLLLLLLWMTRQQDSCKFWYMAQPHRRMTTPTTTRTTLHYSCSLWNCPVQPPPQTNHQQRASPKQFEQEGTSCRRADVCTTA